MISYGRQSISEVDIEAVARVLRSEFLTVGPAVPAFEAALAGRVGCAHAVVVNSATSALHVACLALDVGPGDMVWTCPNSFVASANCARLCGAEVDFVDMDPQTLCMDAHALGDKLQECRRSGKALPKVVIPVHFAGVSCDMPTIHRLGKEFGFKIIEDASHAVGSRVKFKEDEPEEYVGACSYSDICVFSFHPVKIITTGEGGAALTQSDELAHRLRALRSHGITRSAPEMTEPSHGGWYYQMLELGLNYRMTDIQAALGLSQLERLKHFVQQRQTIAARYLSLIAAAPKFSGGNIKTQQIPAYCSPSYHLFVIEVAASCRRRCFEALRDQGYGVNVHYIPIHTQPYYLEQGFAWGDFPHSEHYYRGAISLPIYPDLPDGVPESVVSIVSDALD